MTYLRSSDVEQLQNYANRIIAENQDEEIADWLHSIFASFIHRLIHAGIENVEALLEIIPDGAIRQEVRRSLELNPAMADKQSTDALAREILMLETEPANDD